MLALTASHENILIALLGAFGIVMAATVPMLWAILNNRKAVNGTRQAVEEVKTHLPPNGERMFEMVHQTNVAVADMQAHLLAVRVANVALAAQLEEHLDETEPLLEFVRTLMGERGDG